MCLCAYYVVFSKLLLKTSESTPRGLPTVGRRAGKLCEKKIRRAKPQRRKEEKAVLLPVADRQGLQKLKTRAKSVTADRVASQILCALPAVGRLCVFARIKKSAAASTWPANRQARIRKQNSSPNANPYLVHGTWYLVHLPTSLPPRLAARPNCLPVPAPFSFGSRSGCSRLFARFY